MRMKHSKSAVSLSCDINTGKNQSDCTNSLKCVRIINIQEIWSHLFFQRCLSETNFDDILEFFNILSSPVIVKPSPTLSVIPLSGWSMHATSWFARGRLCCVIYQPEPSTTEGAIWWSPVKMAYKGLTEASLYKDSKVFINLSSNKVRRRVLVFSKASVMELR